MQQADTKTRREAELETKVDRLERLLEQAGVKAERAQVAAAQASHFRDLFEQAPGFVCVLRDREHVIELMNTSFLQLVGHRDIVGKPVREGLPEIEGQGLFELLDQVFETGEAFVGRQVRLTLQREPDAPPEQVVVDFVYKPIVDRGRVSGVFVQGTDISARVRAERQIRAEARLLDAVEQAVIATDLAGTVLYWNRFAEVLYGWSAEEAVGRTVIELKAAPDKQSDAAKLMALLQTGETWSGEIVLRRRDGTTFTAYVIDSPIHDDAGQFIGIVGVSFDITERKQAQEKQALLVRELHHRVKNTLSTVQAIMNSTARASVSMEEFQTSFAGRITSLANTHSLLAEDRWQAVPFKDLLHTELAPYDDGTGKRITLEGPPVVLASELAVPLGMAVHELTTNAAKHGALTEAHGAVEIRWHLLDDGGVRKLCWVWNEHDGPPVQLPTREGFGSRLLNRVLTVQTGADVRIDYQPDGLRVVVAVPVAAQSNLSDGSVAPLAPVGGGGIDVD
jgi:PAS domain S-box-containing protein